MKTVTLFSWEHCRHLPLRHSTVGTHLLSLTPNKGPKLFPVTERKFELLLQGLLPRLSPSTHSGSGIDPGSICSPNES